MADYGKLPETAWVKIMSHLALVDRNRLSRTCRRLSEIFEHPTVWYQVNISMLADLSDISAISKVRPLILPDRFAKMIERFGVYFQDLTLTVVGRVTKVEPACEKVLLLLAETCRLCTLSLRVGELISTSTTALPPSRENLEILATLLRKSFRLRSLDLITWPIHPKTQDFDILACLRENEKMKPLECLSLFCRSARSNTWMPLNASLPSPESVLQTVQHFTALRQLRLCSTMVTEELLKEIAARPLLEKLSILVTYSSNRQAEALFAVQGTAWAIQRPTLRVELTFANTIPHFVLISVLNPRIPLSSIAFMKHSCYTEPLFSYLASHYAATLKEFADFGHDRESFDGEMIEMVQKCIKMNRLIYRSKIRAASVIALATLRGQDWIDFEFNVKNIIIDDDAEVARQYRHDDDDVIGETEQGERFIVAHLPLVSSGFYYTDESEAYRVMSLDAVVAEVTQIIGKKWVTD